MGSLFSFTVFPFTNYKERNIFIHLFAFILAKKNMTKHLVSFLTQLLIPLNACLRENEDTASSCTGIDRCIGVNFALNILAYMGLAFEVRSRLWRKITIVLHFEQFAVVIYGRRIVMEMKCNMLLRTFFPHSNGFLYPYLWFYFRAFFC